MGRVMGRVVERRLEKQCLIQEVDSLDVLFEHQV